MQGFWEWIMNGGWYYLVPVAICWGGLLLAIMIWGNPKTDPYADPFGEGMSIGLNSEDWVAIRYDEEDE